MTALREWAGTLCAAAMLCAILLQFLPSGGASPMMRVILGLFFCCCLFGPIRSLATTDWQALLPPSEQSAQDEETLMETYYQTVQQQADEALRQAVDGLLADSGYRVEKISARWTESEDGGIYLTGADAYLSSEQTANTQEIARLLGNGLGINVIIHPWLGR